MEFRDPLLGSFLECEHTTEVEEVFLSDGSRIRRSRTRTNFVMIKALNIRIIDLLRPIGSYFFNSITIVIGESDFNNVVKKVDNSFVEGKDFIVVEPISTYEELTEKWKQFENRKSTKDVPTNVQEDVMTSVQRKALNFVKKARDCAYYSFTKDRREIIRSLLESLKSAKEKTRSEIQANLSNIKASAEKKELNKVTNEDITRLVSGASMKSLSMDDSQSYASSVHPTMLTPAKIRQFEESEDDCQKMFFNDFDGNRTNYR